MDIHIVIEVKVPHKKKKKIKGKLQISPLKFEHIWILHSKVLEFGFHPLNFRGVWILHSKVYEFGGVKSKHFQTLGGVKSKF